MKQDIKSKLINRKVKKPNPILMSIGMWCVGVLNRFYKVKFTYDYDPKSIKDQPVILLSTHASRLEFIYTIYGFKRHDINVVCGFQNILKKGLYHLFIQLGVISKYLYQPDFMCVKNMLRVLKSGGAIGLFPEGIQSTSGSTHPINPATTHFLKNCKANVVICTTKGAYLATNRYSGDRKKGYISANYSLLFTPKMLEELSEEQIYKTLLEKFRYNDFEYNKTARNKYIGKKPNAFGIDKILYKCPDCKEEHTLYVENDTIACKSCGFSVRVDEYYDLVDLKGKKCPEDIDQWFKWQRRCVAQQITDDSFKMTLDGNLYTIKYDKLRKSPHDRQLLSIGDLTLTNKELSFIGTLDGEKVDFNFSAKSIYSLTFSTKGFLEFYHNNDYFIFVPNKADQCLIKWTLAAEEIHNLYDEKWRSACEDVYEYSKGDIL